MKPALYIGEVAHQRYLPRPHTFQYPFFMWFLNLDELNRLPDLGWWFAIDRWAVNRFHRPDYLGDPATPLADAVRLRMAELTGQPVTGQVCGLMNLRTLGLYFSPVNFYYGFDGEGVLSHFLAEVSNTPWNERHHYAYMVGEGNLNPLQEKAFHVSPFNPLDQHYRWRIEPPGETVGVAIEVSDMRGDVFAARLRLDRQLLTLATARRQTLKRPGMTGWIIGGIYYQALKIYLKGIPYVPYHKEAV
jgi:DUF1365 family protein